MSINQTEAGLALKAIKRCRVRCIMSGGAASAFFGSLLLELEPVAAGAEVFGALPPTMATDGRRLYFSPRYVLEDLRDERLLRGVLVHEVLHAALGHSARQNGREPLLWNIATDLSINQIVLENAAEGGWSLPPDGCFVGKAPFQSLPPNLGAEEYYALIAEKLLEKALAAGATKGGSMGGVIPRRPPGGEGGVDRQGVGAGATAEAAGLEREWKDRMAAAAARASSRGSVPLGIRRMVDGHLKAKADWRRALAEFVTSRANDEVAWHRPQRRHVASGLYLPGPDGERCGPVCVAVDTSGSVDDKTLSAFAAEIRSVAQATGARVDLVYHDAEVQHVQRYRSSDGPLSLEAKGGGGTSHVPVFEWLEKASRDEDYSAFVGLSDMHSAFPDASPRVPVLWCVYGNPNPVVPFGRLVHVEGHR